MMSFFLHFVAYAMLGWSIEILFTAVSNFRKTKSWKLEGHTNLWMFPIYGLPALLFEPVHFLMDVHEVSMPIRLFIYLVGFYIVEFVCGSILLQVTGDYVWKYEKGIHIKHLINISYAPFWIFYVAILELYHDFLNSNFIL